MDKIYLPQAQRLHRALLPRHSQVQVGQGLRNRSMVEANILKWPYSSNYLASNLHFVCRFGEEIHSESELIKIMRFRIG